MQRGPIRQHAVAPRRNEVSSPEATRRQPSASSPHAPIRLGTARAKANSCLQQEHYAATATLAVAI